MCHAAEFLTCSLLRSSGPYEEPYVRRVIVTALTVVLLIMLLAIAVALLIAIFGEVKPDTRAQILLEAAKALLQFMIVIILGGLSGLAINSFDKRRRGYRALQEFRQEFLESLSRSYQDAKRARRALRTVGLTTKFGDQKPPMNTKRCEAYQEQMLSLNDTQLTLERLKIEAGNFRDAFSAKAKLEEELRGMENYVRKVVKEYEQYWGGLQQDPPVVTFENLERLADFTGSFSDSDFRNDFSERYYVAVGLVRQDLLPIHYVHTA